MGNNITAAEIGRAAAELDAALRGAILQEARQPVPLELYLELRVPGESVTVVISAAPDLSRLHATTARPPNPPLPFAFQSLLRARLCGERLQSVAQFGGDRVVVLSFSAERSIVAELTGRHANVFFCARPGQAVHPPRPAPARRRRLRAHSCQLSAFSFFRTPRL